jgi:type VI secretion system secreted protein VgrG
MPEIIATVRNIWVTTSLPDGQLVLEEMSGQESLGAAFAYELGLVSLDPDISLSDLLGQPFTVHVTLPEGERQFNGIVTHAQHGGTNGGHTRYRITLRPWLSLLSYTSNCRIFQDKSVVDIVKEIFRDNGFSDFEDALSGTYTPQEYCVQYRESDFNFVSRLMEHEGIYYYFKHQDAKHTLVLADGYGAHQTTPGYEEIPYKQPNQPFDEDHLDAWIVAQQIRPGAFAATDFDFTRPRANLLSQLNSPLDNARADYALFEFPGQFLTADAGNERVKMRLQESQVSYEIIETAGDARGLGAGTLFVLAEFPRDDQNKEYLIISAQYHIHAANLESGSGSNPDEFRGNYTVLDGKTQFRPSLHASKPRVEGPQTAIVVGQAGEEIWTDKYGRVKVQFHWDRDGKNDEKSSCWVRVAQVWAGAKWGAMHIPRIGQEVLVDFLEGDPDRPIVTGRVYNADNMPPYDLPANQTQSGIKSRSTKGGAPTNFNELRFEDKKGAEQVYAQAEKDLEILVKNDEHRAVGHDRKTDITNDETINVGHDRTEQVTADESVSIGGSRTETVGKQESVTVGASRDLTVATSNSTTVGATNDLTVGASDSTTVGGVQSVSVGGSQSVSVGGSQSVSAGGSQSVDVGKDQSVSVAGGRTLDVAKDETITIAGKRTVNVSKDDILEVTKKLSINVSDEISITTGDATISLKKNGDITIKGKNITFEGSGKINVNASGDLILKGSKIAQN